MPHTGCVVPWTQAMVFPNGEVSPCCYWRGPTSGSLYNKPFDEIWNGDLMQGMRSALGRGEAMPECSKCWNEERNGVVSLRHIFNHMHRSRGNSVDELVKGRQTGGFEAGAPNLFFLNIGNLCNLQCRSCSAGCSSRIAADRVQSTWGEARLQPAWRANRLKLAPVIAEGVEYDGFDLRTKSFKQLDVQQGRARIELPIGKAKLRSLSGRINCPSGGRLILSIDGVCAQEIPLRPDEPSLLLPLNIGGGDRLSLEFEAPDLQIHNLEIERSPIRLSARLAQGSDGQTWFANPSRMADMLEASPGEVTLHILGGEPMMNGESWALLDELVNRGVAERINLVISTNGTHRREDLVRLAPAFRSVYVSVSIDGCGPMFEYLRHNGRWDDLLLTIEWLRAIPNIVVAASTVMQNYNAFDCVRLFRFFDSIDLPFLCHNVLMSPARLQMTNLPPRVRRAAAAQLAAYAEGGCRSQQLEMVQSLVGLMESSGEAFDPVLFREFMLFTNDLDATRGQRLADVAPDLTALISASGVAWTDEIHHAEKALQPTATTKSLERFLPEINRTISELDVIYPGFESGFPGYYFISALRQLDTIDVLMKRHGHAGLEACAAVADYASHYGRITRGFRVAAPHAQVYACDIDPAAAQFCARELGATPMITSWRPDEDAGPDNLDLVVCSSLLTHTGRDHWRRALKGWFNMVRPGGIVVFTYISDRYMDDWKAGRMEHYGSYSEAQREDLERQLLETGLGFAGMAGLYSDDSSYGFAVATDEVVRAEAIEAGFDVLDLVPASETAFGQELAVLRRPALARRSASADVRVLAFYDPSVDWIGLRGATCRTLPTELGFCDPRVAEVREAQAALAHDHGIDGFCLPFVGSETGGRRNGAVREFLQSGRPDFPFCLIREGESALADPDEAEQAFLVLLPYLRDSRYVRVGDRPVLLLRDADRLANALAVCAQWRRLAEENGLPGLHLCALEPTGGVSMEDSGFDAYVEQPIDAAEVSAASVSSALTRAPGPGSLLRTVTCPRGRASPEALDLYELWLRGVMERERRRAPGGIVFINAWNRWNVGAYLEPDEGDGRAALTATRRALLGPAGGPVLLRELQALLNGSAVELGPWMGELEQLLAGREQAYAELNSLIEASLGASALSRAKL